MALKVGDKAPAFSMKTDGGGKVSLSGLKGQNVVLYFYPKDDTSGCTAQACGFRDSLPKFGKIDASALPAPDYGALSSARTKPAK